MTAPLPPESKSPSRRAVLAAAIGGAAAMVARTVIQPSSARAGADGDVVLGSNANTAATLTAITNSGGGTAFQALSTGIGVSGYSSSNVGVYGSNAATNQPASLGYSSGNSTGVQGYSGASLPAAKAKTGIFGSANQDANSKGVWGKSPAGHGIHGESSTGWAGYFDGKVLVKRYIDLAEHGTPSAPVSNILRLFARDKAGKTQLCVRFPNGTIRVIAEP